jgi:hypothetical protein
MAKTERIAISLDYSGGAVSDLHRVPCLSAIEPRLPTTNAHRTQGNVLRGQGDVKHMRIFFRRHQVAGTAITSTGDCQVHAT